MMMKMNLIIDIKYKNTINIYKFKITINYFK